MGFGAYFSSYLLAIALSFLLFAVPAYSLRRLAAEIAGVWIVLAIAGVYSVALYLKPVALPLWTLPVAVNFAALIAVRGRVSPKRLIWPSPETLLILAYCFLLFVFRWEPPGGDPIKWGSLARLIEEYQTFPGDTRPLTANASLSGATLGIPILAALFHLGDWLPMERGLLFLECASMACFALALAQALMLWFSPGAARRAAGLSLALFTVPQQYFGWGGTPTLVGFCAGLLVLDFARGLPPSAPAGSRSRSELGIFAFALGYAAYAHPLGFYLSILVCAPCAGWYLAKRVGLVEGLGRGAALASMAAIAFAPFFLGLRGGVSAGESAATWDWQRQMAPLLFRGETGFLYNLYSQVSAYVWSTAFALSVGLMIASLAFARRLTYEGAAAFFFVAASALVANVLGWWMPLSFLVYPERAGTLCILPLAMPLAWLWEQRDRAGGRRWAGAALAILTVLALQQFRTRLFPLLGASVLTAEDRAAFRAIPARVPREDCIEISPGSAGAWIAVLSFRCTIPFHGLGMNSVDEERRSGNDSVRWGYRSAADSPKGEGPALVELSRRGRAGSDR